ncbi:unnamed protein product, partial [Choristocarpus tenellus]
VRAPELALLQIIVMDKDVDSDDFIAQTVLPVKCIRTGYRSVRLYSGSGTTHGEFEHCSIFCRFCFEDIKVF